MNAKLARLAGASASLSLAVALGCGGASDYAWLPEDVDAKPLHTRLATRPPTPVRAGVVDLICALRVNQGYQKRWLTLPMWGAEGGFNILTHIDMGDRHWKTGAIAFRIPEVSVEPQVTSLTVEVTDQSGMFDDRLGKLELLVGGVWPVEDTNEDSGLSCYGVAPGEQFEPEALDPKTVFDRAVEIYVANLGRAEGFEDLDAGAGQRVHLAIDHYRDQSQDDEGAKQARALVEARYQARVGELVAGLPAHGQPIPIGPAELRIGELHCAQALVERYADNLPAPTPGECIVELVVHNLSDEELRFELELAQAKAEGERIVLSHDYTRWGIELRPSTIVRLEPSLAAIQRGDNYSLINTASRGFGVDPGTKASVLVRATKIGPGETSALGPDALEAPLAAVGVIHEGPQASWTWLRAAP